VTASSTSYPKHGEMVACLRTLFVSDVSRFRPCDLATD
jgi:hypothetical protein